jgi:uncharacterized RDD family membrane protein YckC
LTFLLRVILAAFSPHRSGRVRSAKTPVTKTCLQCGAVLASSVRACSFCDSSFSTESAWPEDCASGSVERIGVSTGATAALEATSSAAQDAPAWQGELAARLDAYRARRRKQPRNSNQSQLPFDDHSGEWHSRGVSVADPAVTVPVESDFSFTIAIGRTSSPPEKRDARMEIDVSVPPASRGKEDALSSKAALPEQYGLYPVATLDERRWAALIDAACLLFAYGGFLALFGSMGGQFTVSKLSAAVYAATFGIVYLQYFALFTIFGGTTPGMMFRGLQVASFTGDLPTPQQMLLRSAGYILSAGTFFLGFFWAWWDEDALTWHDRLSRTYLSAQNTHADLQASGAIRSASR